MTLDAQPVEVQLEDLRATVTRLSRDLEETKGQLQLQGLIGSSSAALSVGSVGYGDRDMLIDKYGIQMLTDDAQLAGMMFRPEFPEFLSGEDPRSSHYPLADVSGYVVAASAILELSASKTSDNHTDVNIANDGVEGVNNSFITLAVVIGNVTTAQILIANKYIDLIGTLALDPVTADPSSPPDGAVWYRSDTDVLYARINGASVDIGGSAAHVADTADAHDASAISVLDTAGNFTGTDVEAVLAELAATGGGMELIVKAADETVNNSTTLQDDDHLLFAVAANEKWQFEGHIFYSTSTVADLKATFSGPASAVGHITFETDVSETATNFESTALGTGEAISGDGAGLIRGMRFWGAIANGANAGNLAFQWAQNTAEVSNTVVHAGSYIKYQQQ